MCLIFFWVGAFSNWVANLRIYSRLYDMAWQIREYGRVL